MTLQLKASLDRMVARRQGAIWREHVVERSVEQQEPETTPVWSRMWLRQRLREPVQALGNRPSR